MRLPWATPPVDPAQALEAVAAQADEPEPPPPLASGVSFAKACVVEGIHEPRRGSEREAVRALLLARGWTTARPDGARLLRWYQPAPHERATW